MDSHQIIPLFSTPLLVTHIGPLDPMITAWVKNLDYPKNAVGQTDHDDQLLESERGFSALDAPQLKKLKNKIQNVVNYFVYNVLDIKKEIEFYFSASWINKLVYSEQIPIHNHPNSLISGTYYIDVRMESSPISFKKSYDHVTVFPNAISPGRSGKNVNQYNQEEYTIYPENGMLAMWPSSVLHEVNYSQEETGRYGLSFNIFCKGKLDGGSHRVIL